MTKEDFVAKAMAMLQGGKAPTTVDPTDTMLVQVDLGNNWILRHQQLDGDGYIALDFDVSPGTDDEEVTVLWIVVAQRDHDGYREGQKEVLTDLTDKYPVPDDVLRRLGAVLLVYGVDLDAPSGAL